MKNNLFLIILLSVVNVYAAVEMDFENNSIGNWTVSGGSISLIDNETLDQLNNKKVLQAIVEKKTMVLKSPWYKVDVAPEEYIEFDYCLKLRNPINYLAFSVILENEAKPLWLPQHETPKVISGRWQHFSMPFKKFKLKQKNKFRCFVVQIDIKNEHDSVIFLIDNFRIVKKGRQIGKVERENDQKSEIVYFDNDSMNPTPSLAIAEGENITVDGNVSEREWKEAAQIVLINNNQNKNLIDKSRIKLCYDHDNIYLAGCFSQSYLDPRKNLLDEIGLKVKTHDGRVWEDDSFEIFLTSNSGDIYHYAINMGGFVYDAKNRDKDYNSKALIATNKDEHHWYLEMAIPKVELNLTSHDKRIKCNFFRNNPVKKEISAWNPTKGFFEQPSLFGSLNFKCGEVVITCFDAEFYKSNFVIKLKKYDSGRLLVKGGDVWSNSEGNYSISMRPNQLGYGQLIISKNGSDIFCSPIIRVNDDREKLKFSVDSDKGILFDLWLNGKHVTEQKKSLALSLTLDKNHNLLVLKVINKYGKTVKLNDNISYQGVRFSINNFIYMPIFTAGQANLDYNQYPLFENNKHDEKEFYLVCRFVKNSVKFSPQLQNDTFYMVNKMPQKVSIRLTSPIDEALEKYTLNLQLPKEITIPKYEHRDRIYNHYTNDLNYHTDDKNIFSFSFNKPIPNLHYNWGNCITMVAIPDFKEGEKRESGKVWRSGKALYELPQTFFIRAEKQFDISPKTNKKKIFITVDFRDQILTTGELVQMLPSWRNIGINLIGNIYRDDKDDTHKHFVAECKKNKIDIVTFLYAPRFIGFTDIMEREKYGEAFTALGKTKNWNRRFCPLHFMKSKSIKQRLEKLASESSAVLQDVEAGVTASCFCPECLEFFSQTNNISAPVSVDVIQKSYMKQWERHVVQVNLLLCKYIFRVMKKRNHELYSMVYSGFHDSPISLYGMDWHLYKNVCDFPMAGYSESHDRIYDLRKVLDGQKIIPGILLDSHVWKYSYASQGIEARLWNIFISGGCVGVNIWNWYDLDGRGFRAINSFARDISRYEDFLDEENQTSEISVPANCYLFKKQDKYLFVGLNFGADVRKLTLSLPRNLSFKNLSTGDYPSNHVMVEIEPEKALLFTFTIK